VSDKKDRHVPFGHLPDLPPTFLEETGFSIYNPVGFVRGIGPAGAVGAPLRSALRSRVVDPVRRALTIEDYMSPSELEAEISRTREMRSQRLARESDLGELNRQTQASRAAIFPQMRAQVVSQQTAQQPRSSVVDVPSQAPVSIDLGRGKYEEAARALRLRDAAAFIAREAQRRGMESVPTDQGQREELLRADQERSAKMQGEAAMERLFNSLPPDVRFAAKADYLMEQEKAKVANQLNPYEIEYKKAQADLLREKPRFMGLGLGIRQEQMDRDFALRLQKLRNNAMAKLQENPEYMIAENKKRKAEEDMRNATSQSQRLDAESRLMDAEAKISALKGTFFTEQTALNDNEENINALAEALSGI